MNKSTTNATTRSVRAFFLLASVHFVLNATGYGAEPAKQAEVALESAVAFPALKFGQPLYVTHLHDGTDRLVVLEQHGRIHMFENKRTVKQARLILDISPKVRREGMEEGLLGLAFHPNVSSNNFVFLQYSATPRRNVISRFKINLKTGDIDPKSEVVILEVPQPYENHNGGMLEFGPDGFLYIGLGDGGSAYDPKEYGQNKGVLHGKMLRIDVDRADAPLNYAIPADNPFLKEKGTRPEIWAYGLRNPWRYSFDRQTGELWAGDVGQNAWEEIDIIKKGKNYGWNRYEGKHDVRPAKKGDAGPYEWPVVEIERNLARSITGGYVYGGKKYPELTGAYIFGDFVTGNLWITRRDKKKYQTSLVGKGNLISSFGEDRDGEIYFTSFDGKVYVVRPKKTAGK